MKTHSRTIFIFMLLIIFQHPSSHLTAQEVQDEDILESQEEINEQSDLIELLETLRAHPIDLNRADLRQLQQIPWLNSVEAKAILTYRNEIGGFKSVAALAEVPGISPQRLENIWEFVTVGAEVSRGKVFSLRQRSRYKQRLEKSVGFQDGTYPNSPGKLYNRLDLALAGNWEGTLLLEKDSGEKHWNDLSIFYLRLNHNPLNSQILIGNFAVESGQGLVLWGTSGFSKGIDPIAPVKKRPGGLKPYTSVDENAAFYGLAYQAQTNALTWLAFISKNKLDATISGTDEVSGFYETGLHRTQLEIAKQDQAEEQIFGGRIQFEHQQHFTLGATAYRSKYQPELWNPDFERGYFAFRGVENRVMGIDFDVYYEKLNLFGELAQSQNGKNGAICGGLFLFESFQYAVLYRQYAKDFQSLHGSGFSRLADIPQNETGIYSGLRVDLFSNTQLSVFYDFYKFPWRRYFQEMPSQGEDFSLAIAHKPVRSFTIKFRWRYKVDDEMVDYTNQYQLEKTGLMPIKRHYFRLHLDYRLSARFLFRNRIETCRIDYPLCENSACLGTNKESGIILYQDVKYLIMKMFTLQGRVCFFDTDSFRSRIYVYENDVPGTMNNRMFVGKGTYWYSLLSYRVGDNLKVHLKYSNLYFDDKQQSGSGSDLINSDTLRDVSIQLEFKF
ncbi:helix-hairpin-helix domain-containing protein [candidate division KSB1 bacterium]|nr:helix-hairpin-helix domain-containing protein [candidate division KSB1 bacterium]